MTMNPEDYVSYPLALALKEAGFDWKCDHCYAKTDESKHEFVCMTVSRDYNKQRDGEPPFLTPICSAVPLWQAQKWLRDMKRLSIEPYANIAVAWNYNIADLDNFAENVGGEVSFSSYESALSAGIAAALELIENEKE